MTQTKIKQQACEILLESPKCTSCETEHKIENLVATASKEDTIAFCKWRVINKYNAIGITNNEIMWGNSGSPTPYTTSELYDIYDADKNKEGI